MSMINTFEEKYRTSAEPWSADDYERYGGYYRKIQDIVAGMPFGPDARMLDIGCGTGHLTDILSRQFKEAIGADISSAAIERAKAKFGAPSLTFKVKDMLTADWQSEGQFNLIVMSQVLYYYSFAEARGAIMKAHAMTKNGGILLLSHSSPEKSPWTPPLYLSLLDGYFEVQHTETFEDHYIVRARKKMQDIVLTLDVELSERSTVREKLSANDVEAEYMAPLCHALGVLNKYGVKSTLFLEVNQLKLFQRYFAAQFEAIKTILQEAHATGLHGFQLHVHGNWDIDNGAKFEDGNIVYGRQRIETQSPGALVAGWLNMFDTLGLPRPVAFRGGKYRPADEKLVRALLTNGVALHSNVIPGAVIVADDGDVFDFRLDALPVVPRSHTSGIEGVIELPIASAQGKSLSLEYADAASLHRTLTDLAFFPGPKILVSHPKDIGNDFEARIAALKEFADRQGFAFQKLSDLDRKELRRSKETMSFEKLRLDDESHALVQDISARYKVAADFSSNLGAGAHLLLAQMLQKIVQSGDKPIVASIDFNPTLVRGHVSYQEHSKKLIVGTALNSKQKLRQRLKFAVRRLLYALPEFVRQPLLRARSAASRQTQYPDPLMISWFS